ncbi:MAG: hypothetical protein WA981_03705 [Glaciecola sp.]
MVNRKVFGFGINDSWYPVRPRSKATKERLSSDWCPYYRKWAHMIQRCYDPKFKHSQTTYKDVSVCDDWVYFSKFREWAINHYEDGLFLDKDILGDGRLYSPENCCFVDLKTNNFILDKGAKRSGKNRIGFYLNKRGKYQVSCSNPFKGKDEYVGVFTSEEEAHRAWKERKRLHAISLAKVQSNERVAKKLLSMYK